MKAQGIPVTSRRSRPGPVVRRLLLLSVSLLIPTALSAQPTEDQRRNFDARIELNRGFSVRPTEAQSAAFAGFRGPGNPDLAVSYDRVTGAARTLVNRVGFLSEGSLGIQPQTLAMDFVRDSSELLGLMAEDLDDVEVTDSVENPVTGSTHIYLRQRAYGLPVYNGQLQINVNRDGNVLSVNNSFLPDLVNSVNATRPVITTAAARQAAAEQIGLDLDRLQQEKPSEPTLMLLPVRRGRARLVWNLQLRTEGQEHYYDFTVDAVTGSVWTRFDWVTPALYEVYPMPVESPNHTSPAPPADARTVVVDPQDAMASPFGWHDTNGVAGAEFTIMRGNNVHAYEDSDANNAPPASEPDCGGSLNCSFALDLSLAPSTYRSAAVANLFYWNNLIHDVQYRYGFDEAAGNFQVNNYGNGGLGGDDVRAEAQDGGGSNNANFMTPPDGSRPRMQMFLWSGTPQIDGDFDNGIIVHEYGHGISNRLVGGPSNVGCLNNNQQPGEGLSDWWALAYTGEVGDAGTDAPRYRDLRDQPGPDGRGHPPPALQHRSGRQYLDLREHQRRGHSPRRWRGLGSSGLGGLLGAGGRARFRLRPSQRQRRRRQPAGDALCQRGAAEYRLLANLHGRAGRYHSGRCRQLRR